MYKRQAPAIPEFLQNSFDRIEFTSACHTDHPPVRWNQELKSEVALFLDHDLLCFDDLNGVAEFSEQNNSIVAMIAIENHFEISDWELIFDLCGVKFPSLLFQTKDGKLCPRYFNFGMVACPKNHYDTIGPNLKSKIEVLTEYAVEHNHKYMLQHTGQLSLSVTIEEFGIPTIPLPIRYNFPNIQDSHLRFDNEFERLKVMHLMSSKNKFDSKKKLSQFLNTYTKNPIDLKLKKLFRRLGYSAVSLL